MLKGWRTFIFGAALAVVPGLLSYLGAVDWQSLGLSPGMGAAIGLAVMGLRAITTTPPMRNALLAGGVALSLSACHALLPVAGGVVLGPMLAGVAVPARVQSACQVLRWGLPIALARYVPATLTPNEQALLVRAQAVVGDCVDGNVVAGAEEVTAGLVDLLYSK